MRVQYRAGASHPHDGKMDGGLCRRPAMAPCDSPAFIQLKDLRRSEAAFVHGGGGNSQVKRIVPYNGAEISAGAQDPAARIEVAPNFGQYGSEIRKPPAPRVARGQRGSGPAR